MSAYRNFALAAALAMGVALPGVAAAQGWGGGDRGGYSEDRGGNWQNAGDRDGRRGDWSGNRRGGDDYRRGNDYERRDYDRRGDDDRRGWDGDRRRPGWGGGPYGPRPGGARWYHGRWWNYGSGPCWRWSQWRQNWKWVCD